MKLETAIEYMDASAPELNPALQSLDIRSFSIDSREVQAGDIFFALSQPDYQLNGFNGDFEDATVYVPSAFEKGAAACVVRRDRFEEHFTELAKFEDRLIFVEDAVVALQDLANGVYLEWNKPVVAVTGSAGKTTAKELIAHVLGGRKKVLRNIKNYNNGLGHPLTVLNLVKDPSYDVAVLEMGMSTPMHEIARLCSITPPDVAVVLNVLPVHVEHLGSIENVAAAKAEIVQGMKPGGTAVLNSDDRRVAAMGEFADGDIIFYSLDRNADVVARDIEFPRFGETTFRLVTPGGEANVMFRLNGRHNILNALSAAAVGYKFGLKPAEIAERLSTAEPPPQRGEVIHFADRFTVINDSYNSNPDALLSMVKTLVEGSTPTNRKIVVAGEMLELGDSAAEIHHETGIKIAESGIDMLIGVRGLAAELVRGAEANGLTESAFAVDSDAAGDMLANVVGEGDVVLIKGSRGVRTEKVLEKLLEKFKTEAESAAV